MQIGELPLTKRTLSYSAAAAKCWFCARAHWWVELPAWARRSSEVSDRHFIVRRPHHKEAGGGLFHGVLQQRCERRLQPHSPPQKEPLSHRYCCCCHYSHEPTEKFCGWRGGGGRSAGPFRRRVCEVSPFSLLWRLTTHATAGPWLGGRDTLPLGTGFTSLPQRRVYEILAKNWGRPGPGWRITDLMWGDEAGQAALEQTVHCLQALQ